MEYMAFSCFSRIFNKVTCPTVAAATMRLQIAAQGRQWSRDGAIGMGGGFLCKPPSLNAPLWHAVDIAAATGCCCLLPAASFSLLLNGGLIVWGTMRIARNTVFMYSSC